MGRDGDTEALNGAHMQRDGSVSRDSLSRDVENCQSSIRWLERGLQPRVGGFVKPRKAQAYAPPQNVGLEPVFAPA